LLLRRYRTGYQDGNYGVVAGHLDGGERIRVAAAREAREEVGVEIASDDLEVIGVMHRLSDDERIDFFLTARSWSGRIINMEPDRCDRLAWFDLDDLPENVIPYVRRALDNYRHGRWFDSFGWPCARSVSKGVIPASRQTDETDAAQEISDADGLGDPHKESEVV
jgi:8-oxo-dGTP pyrophosphatase MutT (NUDIX family)